MIRTLILFLNTVYIQVLPESFGTGIFFEKKSKDISRSPLAKELFKVSGVKSIFFGRMFITITKESKEGWQVMKPQIFAKVLDFYADDMPLLLVHTIPHYTTLYHTIPQLYTH